MNEKLAEYAARCGYNQEIEEMQKDAGIGAIASKGMAMATSAFGKYAPKVTRAFGKYVKEPVKAFVKNPGAVTTSRKAALGAGIVGASAVGTAAGAGHVGQSLAPARKVKLV